MKRRKEEKQTWEYVSASTGKTERVYCTRRDYLFLKMCYDVTGLSPEEYKEYKSLSA